MRRWLGSGGGFEQFRKELDVPDVVPGLSGEPIRLPGHAHVDRRGLRRLRQPRDECAAAFGDVDRVVAHPGPAVLILRHPGDLVDRYGRIGLGGSELSDRRGHVQRVERRRRVLRDARVESDRCRRVDPVTRLGRRHGRDAIRDGATGIVRVASGRQKPEARVVHQFAGVGVECREDPDGPPVDDVHTGRHPDDDPPGGAQIHFRGEVGLVRRRLDVNVAEIDGTDAEGTLVGVRVERRRDGDLAHRRRRGRIVLESDQIRQRVGRAHEALVADARRPDDVIGILGVEDEDLEAQRARPGLGLGADLLRGPARGQYVLRRRVPLPHLGKEVFDRASDDDVLAQWSPEQTPRRAPPGRWPARVSRPGAAACLPAAADPSRRDC